MTEVKQGRKRDQTCRSKSRLQYGGGGGVMTAGEQQSKQGSAQSKMNCETIGITVTYT